jgi:uncharacterized membrane protein
MARLLLLGESANARFLLGAIAMGDYELRHVESRQRLDQLDERYDLVVISDYTAGELGPAAAAAIVEQVEQGTGLIMIGGWGSFTSENGFWGTSPLGPLLPVICANSDDRRNVAGGVWLEAVEPNHPVLAGLSIASPPVVCGYNQVELAPGATLVLRGRHVAFDSPRASVLSPRPGEAVPLLAIGSAGQGRTLAYMSDLVPHWVGGLVDWGTRRLHLSSGAWVGDEYVTFVLNMLRWATGAGSKTR